MQHGVEQTDKIPQEDAPLINQVGVRDSDTSLRKLCKIFGPEFNTLTGIPGGKKVST